MSRIDLVTLRNSFAKSYMGWELLNCKHISRYFAMFSANQELSQVAIDIFQIS